MQGELGVAVAGRGRHAGARGHGGGGHGGGGAGLLRGGPAGGASGGREEAQDPPAPGRGWVLRGRGRGPRRAADIARRGPPAQGRGVATTRGGSVGRSIEHRGGSPGPEAAGCEGGAGCAAKAHFHSSVGREWRGGSGTRGGTPPRARSSSGTSPSRPPRRRSRRIFGPSDRSRCVPAGSRGRPRAGLASPPHSMLTSPAPAGPAGPTRRATRARAAVNGARRSPAVRRIAPSAAHVARPGAERSPHTAVPPFAVAERAPGVRQGLRQGSGVRFRRVLRHRVRGGRAEAPGRPEPEGTSPPARLRPRRRGAAGRGGPEGRRRAPEGREGPGLGPSGPRGPPHGDG